MRVFLAVEMPEQIRSALAALQQDLAKRGVQGVRWVEPTQSHLTLRFCGEVSSEGVVRLAEALSPGAPHAPFSVFLDGLGVFPPRGAPRVLWVGVEGSRLYPLVAWIEEKVVGAGLPGETKPFHPHLTVGRFRSPARRLPKEVLTCRPPVDFGEISVVRFALFESRAGERGPHYNPLYHYRLHGEAAPGGGR